MRGFEMGLAILEGCSAVRGGPAVGRRGEAGAARAPGVPVQHLPLAAHHAQIPATPVPSPPPLEPAPPPRSASPDLKYPLRHISHTLIDLLFPSP